MIGFLSIDIASTHRIPAFFILRKRDYNETCPNMKPQFLPSAFSLLSR